MEGLLVKEKVPGIPGLPFAKGNPGPGVPGPGRPGRKAILELEKAAEYVKRQLRKNIKGIASTYIELASGNGRDVDPPTTRHAIERLIPQARQEIDIRAAIAIVEVSSFDPDAQK